MKRDYFGTDGVRGPYGGPLINESFAARLGCAAARWTLAQGRSGPALIGRDTRASGPALVEALANGLRAGGLEPVTLDICPTPAVARLVRSLGSPLGVVVTASHNPAEDNGIKFFAPGGLKLTDADEAAIEALLPPADALLPANAALRTLDALSPYIEELAARLPTGALSGWRIVTDTAHGATSTATPAALRRLGAEVFTLGASPDGLNINSGCGSEHPEGLSAAVRSHHAALGIAHDGDGDRCILCDETGSPLDGDEILVLLAVHALRQGQLPKNTLVVTVQSNLGVDAAVRAAGGRVERTDVGDRHVLARLLTLGATLGGESSGHILDLSASPTGDGLAAALGVIAVMRETGQPLSALRGGLVKFPQRTRNLRIATKRPLAACPALTATIGALEAELGARGRVMVRFSGTETKLRLLAEADTDAAVSEALARLETAARTDLTVLG